MTWGQDVLELLMIIPASLARSVGTMRSFTLIHSNVRKIVVKSGSVADRAAMIPFMIMKISRDVPVIVLRTSGGV